MTAEVEIETGGVDDELGDVEKQLMEELERVRRVRREGGSALPAEPEPEEEPDDEVWELTTRSNQAVKPYEFKLDGEPMYAARRMPAGFALDLLEGKVSMRNLDRGGQFRMMLEMLQSILWPESMAVIHERMRNPKNPIELEDLAKIINQLSKVVYGRRPTQQSSGSSSVQPTTGTGSTDGAQPSGSTSEPSETTPSSST